MKIDIVTIFPDFFHGPMDYGIIRRAREAGLVTIEVHDLRAFAHDKHRTVDDRPFGGGGYEGVDERVGEYLADCELSIGDYVLSGGELGAAVIADAVTRLIPGAVGNEASTRQESFSATEPGSGDGPSSTCVSGGLLDYPHYTRPADFRGMQVPEVLVSGNHEEIRRWRRIIALKKTIRNRPDLLSEATLNDVDKALLARIKSGTEKI